MKFRTLHPEFVNLPEEDFIDRIPYQTVINLFMQIADYYNENLKLWEILRTYGIYDVDEYTEQAQVSCLCVEHGSSDHHKSARYFSVDRDTGNHRPAVYCYKCNKLLTTFWLLYKYEKDHHDLNSKEIFKLISKTFRVPFPRDLILDFDPEKFFTFDESEEDRKKALEGFKYAESLRQFKTDPPIYCEKLNLLMKGEM